jgi:hypothetical protein
MSGYSSSRPEQPAAAAAPRPGRAAAPRRPAPATRRRGRQRKQRGWVIPLLLASSGWLVLAVMLTPPLQPVRPAAMFAFALICPGLALVRLLPIHGLLERAVLAAALGLSTVCLVAEAAAIQHVLQPAVVQVILAGICTTAAGAEIARA